MGVSGCGLSGREGLPYHPGVVTRCKQAAARLVKCLGKNLPGKTHLSTGKQLVIKNGDFVRRHCRTTRDMNTLVWVSLVVACLVEEVSLLILV